MLLSKHCLHYLAIILLTAASARLPLKGESYYSAWIQEYNPGSPTAQFGRAIAMDGRGNVVVTGRAIVSDRDQMYTAKYDALDGHLVWEQSVGAGNADFAGTTIVADSEGNVIVSGTRNIGGAIDYYTIKYNGATGAPVWPAARIYNGTASGADTPVKVVVDSNDDVIVTGSSSGMDSGLDIVTIKYAKTNGAQIGVADRYTTAFNRDDVPGGLAVDANDNIVVAGTAHTGSGQFRFYVRKLNPTLGFIWDITPIDTGDAGGARSVVVDGNNNVIATGLFFSSSRRGYFTIKLAGTNGAEIWSAAGPLGVDTFGTGGATSVAVGPDNNPIVTGWVTDASGTDVIRTIKYTAGGFFGSGSVIWDITDTGLGIGDSTARQVVADGAGNAIIVGETSNHPNGPDIYFAKYNGTTGDKVFSGSYDGTQSGSDDGNGVAVDPIGNFAVLGTPFRRENSIGLKTITTFKFNRFIASTGDALPDEIPGVPEEAVFAAGGTPAIAADGSVVAAVSLKSGRKNLRAILHEGGASPNILPAVQGQPAPVRVGESPVNWVSFSDPVIAPNGTYAFSAKVTGKLSTGVWSNLAGSLQPALRVGDPVPGLDPTANIKSIGSISLRNNSLIAVIKVTGSGSSSAVLARVDGANTVTALLRSGQPGLDIGGTDYTVKKFTVLSPTSLSPGDGRWQATGGVVVKVSAVATANKKDARDVILRITNAGVRLVVASSASPATGIEATTNFQAFGVPSIGGFSSQYAFSTSLAKLSGTVSSANDTALVYSATGASYTPFAREGSPTGVSGIDSAISYAGFSDPIINSNLEVAFVATLKGSGVGGANKSVLIFGDPTGTLEKVARTGDVAPARQPIGLDAPEGETRFAGFSSFVLSGGANGGPIFLSKLKGAASGKTNLGLFAVDSTGAVRRLMRTGDVLGTQTIKSITILKATPTVLSAARNFNAGGVVTLAVSFTDRTSALLAIGIP